MNDYWKEFLASGTVEDYLKYRTVSQSADTSDVSEPEGLKNGF